MVEAEDEAGNVSDPSAASDPITTEGVAFGDDFSSGDFSKWTETVRMQIDLADGGAAPPSALISPNDQSAFARAELDAPMSSACLSSAVRVTDPGTVALDLIRVRSGAGEGPVAKTYLNSSGQLVLRSDFAPDQKQSGVALPTGWSTIEMCGSVGPTSTWDLYLNGVKIIDAWQADTGTQPITQIQIGDSRKRTVVANWDDVTLDGEPG